MSESIGIVLPAYNPDPQAVRDYALQIRHAIDPAVIRIELDDPDLRDRRRVQIPSAEVNTVRKRRGKGAAISDGLDALDTDILVFADSDGSTSVRSLENVIDSVAAGNADLAVGSRRHPGALVVDSQSTVRRTLGDLFAWFARLILPISLYDYQCGAKAIDGDRWSVIRDDIYESGFGWDIGLIAAAAAHGLTVHEVPIQWEDRPESTVSPLETSIELVAVLARTRWRQFDDGATDSSLQARLSYGKNDRE